MQDRTKPARNILAMFMALLFHRPWIKGFPLVFDHMLLGRVLRHVSVWTGMAIGEWRFGEGRGAVALSPEFRWDVLRHGEDGRFMAHYLAMMIDREYPGQYAGEDFPLEEVYKELLVQSGLPEDEIALGRDGNVSFLTPLEVALEVEHVFHIYKRKNFDGPAGSARELAGLVRNHAKFLQGLPDEELHGNTREEKRREGGRPQQRRRDREDDRGQRRDRDQRWDREHRRAEAPRQPQERPLEEDEGLLAMRARMRKQREEEAAEAAAQAEFAQKEEAAARARAEADIVSAGVGTEEAPPPAEEAPPAKPEPETAEAKPEPAEAQAETEAQAEAKPESEPRPSGLDARLAEALASGE